MYLDQILAPVEGIVFDSREFAVECNCGEFGTAGECVVIDFGKAGRPRYLGQVYAVLKSSGVDRLDGRGDLYFPQLSAPRESITSYFADASWNIYFGEAYTVGEGVVGDAVEPRRYVYGEQFPTAGESIFPEIGQGAGQFDPV